MTGSSSRRASRCRAPLLLAALLPLGGCATVGSLMSPYSEKYACKNDDHGQCIDPDRAYADAVAGRPSRSQPGVTRDRKLLRAGTRAAWSAERGHDHGAGKTSDPVPDAYAGYRDSVYRELQGLIDQPVTPMLKSPRTVRTLILPYADRQRPDRLYMPRYIFSILETPAWVVGDYLAAPVSPARDAPVLGQVRDSPTDQAAPVAPGTVEEPRR